MSFLVPFFCVYMARKFSERERYFIPVDGKLIEVTRAVYIAYYQAERKERYLKEQERKYGVVYMGGIEEKYIEDCLYRWNHGIDTEAQAVDNVYLDQIKEKLNEQEWEVVKLCCLQGYSLRSASEKTGIHYLKIRRILKHIGEKIKNIES